MGNPGISPTPRHPCFNFTFSHLFYVFFLMFGSVWSLYPSSSPSSCNLRVMVIPSCSIYLSPVHVLCFYVT
ncbi:hypothetical protein L873DRAFT_288411 [Choiromyces venosus 120613-1]|uniref:Uncharacterized protein n=1 Tax=Choiromyces venosus 120613-1 TaxID=1336337 RepID=A0A3N4K1I0_9PEZI|nr:hypothetical protein L873DRAFT_288411 [Choiromyces venosus 120613-1]